jgi:hypothetical protein
MKVADAKFERWTNIEALYNVRRTVSKFPIITSLDGGETYTKVSYRGKIKLHGTNSAIQLCEDGIVCQSRNNIITPSDDNAGFASWANSVSNAFNFFQGNAKTDCIVFGEWCGKGIQNAVSISKIDKKVFAIFSVKLGERYIVDPDEIRILLTGKANAEDAKSLMASYEKDNIYVLPWYSDEVHSVSLLGLDEEFESIVSKANAEILKIEDNDPWVSDNFGVTGPGEGLVFYPISHMDRFSDLTWKAKGEKHRAKETKVAVQISPEKIAEARKFAEIFTTESRLMQGATALSSTGQPVFDPKLTGQFIGWLAKDVSKECQDELEESGLEWKDISKHVTDIGRKWYSGKATS